MLLFALHRCLEGRSISMRENNGDVDDVTRGGSALALLVARIRTDHANNALATHNFALVADALDRRTNLHHRLRLCLTAVHIIG